MPAPPNTSGNPEIDRFIQRFQSAQGQSTTTSGLEGQVAGQAVNYETALTWFANLRPLSGSLTSSGGYRPVIADPTQYRRQMGIYEGVRQERRETGISLAANGAMRFENGVIVVPSEVTGYEEDLVLYPPDLASREKIKGTKEWVAKAMGTWSDKKVQAWRKKLYEQGYEVERAGGWDQYMVEALKTFHHNRYVNGGEVIPLVSTIDSKAGARAAFKEAFTDDEVTQSVQTMFAETFGDDPDESELENWKQLVKREAMRLARRKGYSGGRLQQATLAAAETEFEENPVVKRHMEFDEENTDLHDGLVSMAEAISSL